MHFSIKEGKILLLFAIYEIFYVHTFYTMFVHNGKKQPKMMPGLHFTSLSSGNKDVSHKTLFDNNIRY